MLQTIPRLFAAGGFFLPVGQGASAGWRFVVWSNPLIELVLDVPRGHTCRSTASVRTGPAPFCIREGVFAPGAGAPTARWCPERDEHRLVRNAGCSAPALRHMHPERSGFVRVGAPPRCERGQHLSASGRAFSHPGRVLLQRGGALGGRAPARPQCGCSAPALELTPRDRGFPAWVCFPLRLRGAGSG